MCVGVVGGRACVCGCMDRGYGWVWVGLWVIGRGGGLVRVLCLLWVLYARHGCSPRGTVGMNLSMAVSIGRSTSSLINTKKRRGETWKRRGRDGDRVREGRSGGRREEESRRGGGGKREGRGVREGEREGKEGGAKKRGRGEG